MDKIYDPKRIEDKWYRAWTEQGVFHGDPKRGGEPYCIMIPPPNVTGILHMGHALNNTIQDILIRWRRMQGRNTLWMPGTDHAGIATQNVVERALKAEGKSREDLGREAFIERVWQWQKQYGNTIIEQLKRLGSSCDWERERFTMDEGLSDAVADVFISLYEKGLICRGEYIINWCPRCATALSDEESEHAETIGKLYYVRYPVRRTAPGAGRDHIIVATTRPETLLGDVAVAISPADARYRDLPGQTVLLPILGRELRVIEDSFVDPQFGTGVVKVTPAHDPNDFEMGKRHGLTPINVMNGDGVMNAEAGPYSGMDRFVCRKKILKDLEAGGLLEKVEEHRHSVGHCYRCDTIVEPRLSRQWFVKMKPLAGPALEAVRSGQVRFIPNRWTKVYLDWMENIRDWCISRQIWWGHRIPVFYCDSCDHQWAAKGAPKVCPQCRHGQVRQDEDVLDTWFSSWLWPFSTLGWPKRSQELEFYYPTHDLVTASEIIFFWVARMIMAGQQFMGDVPFRNVYIHGTVRDARGRKMSKSLGNAIDPLTVIDKFSADALRLSLTMLTATGQDVYVSDEKFEVGRNFGTKLWNAARFMQMHTEGHETRPQSMPALDPALLSADDKHILARLQAATAACTESLTNFRFNDAALALYDFIWHQYCDWYVEYSKEALKGDEPARRGQVLNIMHYVFSSCLRLLHPIMPFITEELWHAMGYAGEAAFIVMAPWPEPLADTALEGLGIDRASVEYVDEKHELVRAGRTLRIDCGIEPAKKVGFLIKPHSEEAERRLKVDQASLKLLLRAESLKIGATVTPGKATPSAITRLATIYMPVEGLIDIGAEVQKLSAQIEKVEDDLKRVAAKLDNEAFVSRAPPEVVDQQRARRKEFLETREKLGRLLDALREA